MAKATEKSYDGFTDDERAAMKDRAKELKSASRRPRGAKVDEEAEVLAKIAELPEPERALAERVHTIVKASEPTLAPRLWYGSPAYYKDGKLLCFFQSSLKFKTRYSTLGFSDLARLDDGTMWATSYALTEMTPETEARIGALVKQAAG